MEYGDNKIHRLPAKITYTVSTGTQAFVTYSHQAVDVLIHKPVSDLVDDALVGSVALKGLLGDVVRANPELSQPRLDHVIYTTSRLAQPLLTASHVPTGFSLGAFSDRVRVGKGLISSVAQELGAGKTLIQGRVTQSDEFADLSAYFASQLDAGDENENGLEGLMQAYERQGWAQEGDEMAEDGWGIEVEIELRPVVARSQRRASLAAETNTAIISAMPESPSPSPTKRALAVGRVSERPRELVGLFAMARKTPLQMIEARQTRSRASMSSRRALSPEAPHTRSRAAAAAAAAAGNGGRAASGSSASNGRGRARVKTTTISHLSTSVNVDGVNQKIVLGPSGMKRKSMAQLPIPPRMTTSSAVESTKDARLVRSKQKMQQITARPSPPPEASPATPLVKPECAHCGTTDATTWRVKAGQRVCNACGIYWNTHKQKRPMRLHGKVPERRKSRKRDRGGTAESEIQPTSEVGTPMSEVGEPPAQPARLNQLKRTLSTVAEQQSGFKRTLSVVAEQTHERHQIRSNGLSRNDSDWSITLEPLVAQPAGGPSSAPFSDISNVCAVATGADSSAAAPGQSSLKALLAQHETGTPATLDLPLSDDTKPGAAAQTGNDVASTATDWASDAELAALFSVLHEDGARVSSSQETLRVDVSQDKTLEGIAMPTVSTFDLMNVDDAFEFYDGDVKQSTAEPLSSPRKAPFDFSQLPPSSPPVLASSPGSSPGKGTPASEDASPQKMIAAGYAEGLNEEQVALLMDI